MNTPQTTSHGSGDQMDCQIYDFFESKAKDVLEMCAQRTCDLALFKQVKQRFESGKDLSNELPRLKLLNKRQALAVVNTLIKACNSDLDRYWALPKAAKAELMLKHQRYKGDLVPRFKARYTFKTKLGTVDITVTTQGRYIGVLANTDDIKKANTGLAFREVDKRLTLAKLDG